MKFKLELEFNDGEKRLLIQEKKIDWVYGQECWDRFSYYKMDNTYPYWRTIESNEQFIARQGITRVELAQMYGEPIPTATWTDYRVTGIDYATQTVTITGTDVTPQPTIRARELQYEEERRMHQMHVEAHGEMLRRHEQRLAERARLEEERNRPRRPWERVRDMFR